MKNIPRDLIPGDLLSGGGGVHEVQELTVRFVSHRGIFTALCQFAEYGFWATHCEVRLPSGHHLGSWYSKGGVRIVPHDYDAGEFTRELYVTIEVTDEQARIFYAFLDNQVGKPYDWRSIVGFYLPNFRRDWQRRDAWFCDELIAGALVACGKFPQRVANERNRITVFDFSLLTGMIAKEE